MLEQFAPSSAIKQPVRSVGRRRIGIFLFSLVVLATIFFGYKVLSYYRKIQQGVINPSNYSFESTLASQARLVAIAKTAPGSGQLATTDDPSLGPADAKLTIVQFADFGCPYSAQESYVVTALAKQYPDDVRVIYRDFPLPDLHPGADLAAQAGGCANEQGKFWEYHDVLFRNSGIFTSAALIDYASQVGLNLTAFKSCLDNERYAHEVSEDLADGVASGVVGTPTFFMNGAKIDGAVPYAVFKDMIGAFLNP